MENTKAGQLRALFASKPLIWVAGAHNGLSAKLVERNGFDAIWASGLEISTSFGLPDASILTMSEFLAVARSIDEVVNLPVIADCDCGFGDASIVHYMTRKYQAAGIAAVCIEDKQFPKTNSFIPGHQELASIEEFADKIQAAVSAKSSEDFMVIARIEALIAGQGQQEALARGHAYADAGADAILIHSRRSDPGEVFEFARAWQGRQPLVVIPTSYYEVTAAQIEQAGIRMVIYANYAMRSAVRAMDETLSRIHAMGTTREVESEIASLQDLFELQDMHEVHKIRG